MLEGVASAATCWVYPLSGSSVPAGQSTRGRQGCGTALPFRHMCPGGHTCKDIRTRSLATLLA